ncbi:MAG: hypothetical protein LBR28_06185 [Bacteroidales bacterium]|nr:hypothetical protein [Bacteroidales bacterium]
MTETMVAAVEIMIYETEMWVVVFPQAVGIAVMKVKSFGLMVAEMGTMVYEIVTLVIEIAKNVIVWIASLSLAMTRVFMVETRIETNKRCGVVFPQAVGIAVMKVKSFGLMVAAIGKMVVGMEARMEG